MERDRGHCGKGTFVIVECYRKERWMIQMTICFKLDLSRLIRFPILTTSLLGSTSSGIHVASSLLGAYGNSCQQDLSRMDEHNE